MEILEKVKGDLSKAKELIKELRERVKGYKVAGPIEVKLGPHLVLKAETAADETFDILIVKDNPTKQIIVLPVVTLNVYYRKKKVAFLEYLFSPEILVMSFYNGVPPKTAAKAVQNLRATDLVPEVSGILGEIDDPDGKATIEFLRLLGQLGRVTLTAKDGRELYAISGNHVYLTREKELVYKGYNPLSRSIIVDGSGDTVARPSSPVIPSDGGPHISEILTDSLRLKVLSTNPLDVTVLNPVPHDAFVPFEIVREELSKLGITDIIKVSTNFMVELGPTTSQVYYV